MSKKGGNRKKAKKAAKIREMQDKFLTETWSLIDYCEKDASSKSSREKLELFAHSLFNLIDGCAQTQELQCGMALVPRKEKKGKIKANISSDIGGCLAQRMYSLKPAVKNSDSGE